MGLGKKTFLGVFPRDFLRKAESKIYPQALIVNTDDSMSPGEHWCGIYFDINAKGYFFDPLGNPPLTEWISFLSSGNGTWEFLTCNVQPKMSINCGLYVMLFLLRMHYSDPPIHIKRTTGLLKDVNEINIVALVKEFVLSFK
jgi:hypothetical protein